MCSKLEDTNVDNIVTILEKWQMEEFIEFVKEKQIDGRKLSDVTEGIVKLWRPKANAKKFISFIEDLKQDPGKYLDEEKGREITQAAVIPIECQYQTVKKNKVETTSTSNNVSSIEELLKKLVPAKSFLYRNQPTKLDKTVPSYLPMDGGTKKPRTFFRLSSYEYPQFDILSRFSRHESSEDRGYYSVKTNSRYYTHKTYKRQDLRTKYKSLQSAEEINEKFPEDHFYEDLCYNDITKEESKPNAMVPITQVKPCFVKLQELFNSFKVPFFKRSPEPQLASEQLHPVEEKKMEVAEKEKEKNIYENFDSVTNMYDSVQAITRPVEVDTIKEKHPSLPVEDYLDPVQLSRDYCDVALRQKDDSLLGYIISIFENRFGIRRETSDENRSDESYSEDEKTRADEKERASGAHATGSDRNERTARIMADRPLPVPVENEPYYMNIDRAEAENLLKGQPDGTFVLRPSSQPNHAYTLSVSCSNAVHNVGVRRRPDCRLALGFARRGERSFASVPSLLRHHRKRRLLLVAAGGVLGATTLNETPHYYQTPSNIPIMP